MVDINKIKEEGGRLHQEVRKRTTDYILAAFGFVAGLAWNEAIKGIIEAFLPTQNSAIAKLVYALILTVILVVVSGYLIRSSSETAPTDKK